MKASRPIVRGERVIVAIASMPEAHVILTAAHAQPSEAATIAYFASQRDCVRRRVSFAESLEGLDALGVAGVLVGRAPVDAFADCGCRGAHAPMVETADNVPMTDQPVSVTRSPHETGT